MATRFKGLPDVHYSDDRHWLSGNKGVSEWLLTGTTPFDKERLKAAGYDEMRRLIREEDPARPLAAGFHRHVAKPVTADGLVRCVAAAIEDVA